METLPVSATKFLYTQRKTDQLMKLRTPAITSLLIITLTLPHVSALSEPVMVGEGKFPSLAQDNRGEYWLVFSNESGLYLMHSSNLLDWSVPKKLPFSKPNDFDPYMRYYDGRFFIAFVRHKITSPHSLFGFDYDVYLAVGSDEKWSLIQINNSNFSLDWYPYIYRDPSGKFWMVYSKDFKDGNGSILVVRFSRDGVNWSREYPAIPPNALFGSLFYFKDRYWMIYSMYTGNYSIPEIMNLHDLYITYSFDGVNWEKAAKLTDTPPHYNFTLYLDAETDGEYIWVAYTSTVEGNEEIYLMKSPDGIRWSKPIRLTRNIEYINSMTEPRNFKCDQKDLLINSNRDVVIAYQSAIYPEKTTLWVVSLKPEINQFDKKIEFNITLSYGNGSEFFKQEKNEGYQNPEQTSIGILPLICGFIATLAIVSRKRRNI